jgi:hypothetical protein
MNTDELVEQARAKFDHAAAKRALKEKYQAKLIFGYRGGMFCAGPELLTLLHACPVQDDVVILDLYSNPVKISPSELEYIVLERWQEQMNSWLTEFEENSKKR